MKSAFNLAFRLGIPGIFSSISRFFGRMAALEAGLAKAQKTYTDKLSFLEKQPLDPIAGSAVDYQAESVRKKEEQYRKKKGYSSGRRLLSAYNQAAEEMGGIIQILKSASY